MPLIIRLVTCQSYRNKQRQPIHVVLSVVSKKENYKIQLLSNLLQQD